MPGGKYWEGITRECQANSTRDFNGTRTINPAIVGYAMGERMKPKLTGKALFRAVQQHRSPAGIIHYSDHGSQYYAEKYQTLLK
jgi:transposase InsO family protein